MPTSIILNRLTAELAALSCGGVRGGYQRIARRERGYQNRCPVAVAVVAIQLAHSTQLIVAGPARVFRLGFFVCGSWFLSAPTSSESVAFRQ